jgi:SSS family solute:Na+ symporter
LHYLFIYEDYVKESLIHFLDISIILLFLAYAIYSGFSKSKKASENLEEYFLAGRSLNGWEAGISMAATQFAADTPLMVMGMIATAGIYSLWRLWIYALAFLLLGFVLSRSWRRANVLTDAELTELRYGSKPALILRGIKALYFGTIFNCTVLAMVLLAATRIAEPFLIWNEWLPAGLYEVIYNIVVSIDIPFTVNTTSPEVWILSTNNMISIMAIVFVTTLYSTTGGLRSVVATDKFQFFLMMIGTFLFMWIAVDKTGGFSMLSQNIADAIDAGKAGDNSFIQLMAFAPDTQKDLGIGLLFVFAFQWLIQINADGTGYLAQRTMACVDEKEAKKASIIFTFAQILFRSVLWIPLGIALMLIYPFDAGMSDVATREFTYVLGMKDLLPVGVKGIMLTAMLAALASTVDTHLNWGSSYWSNDFYKRILFQHFLKKDPFSKKPCNSGKNFKLHYSWYRSGYHGQSWFNKNGLGRKFTHWCFHGYSSHP